MKKLLVVLIFFFVLTFESFAFNCPSKTTPGRRFITFVGKAGLGGDKQVEVWFEYGTDENNLKPTKSLILYNDGIYCLKVKGLKPCTTYYYRAAAKNSAGTNYGEIKSVSTLCSNKKSENLIDKIRNWVVF